MYAQSEHVNDNATFKSMLGRGELDEYARASLPTQRSSTNKLLAHYHNKRESQTPSSSVPTKGKGITMDAL